MGWIQIERLFLRLSALERIPALASRSIDGVLMTYDEGYKAKKHGYKILANAADYPSLLILSSAIGVNPDFARKNPELVKRFLSANVQALSFMRENPEATLRVIMTWLKLDLETAEAVQQLAVGNFTKDGTIDDSVLKEIVQQQMSEANIKDPVALSKVADFSLLRQVVKETRLP
jgi:ABC-type nitrate/sulfonate/bicarbonate transport system substrate-binding protein